MASRDYFASAFVRVKPDPKGFRGELREQIRSATSRGAFKFPVEPDLKAFRGKLNRQLKQAPFDVKIRPDITGFRSAVREKLAGFTVPVKVVPIGVTEKQFAAAAGAAAAAPASATGRATKVATEREERLTAAQRKGAAIKGQAANAQRLYNEALLQEAGSIERVTRLEALHGTLTKQVAANQAAATAANEAAAVGQAEHNRALEQAITAENARLIALEKTVATQKAADEQQLRATALRKATTAAEKEATTLLAVEAGQLTKTNELRTLRADLLAVEAKLQKNVAEAEFLEISALENQNKALLRNVELQILEAEARQASISSAAKAATQYERIGRGAGSAGLGLLGLRGAVLAANFEFLAGAVAIAAFTKAVGAAASLETELNVFQATAGATANEMEKVRQQALALGSDITLPAVGAQDAAEAMTELAKAGLSVEDSLAGARGVLQLATAANIDNEKATLLVANALNAFSLSGRDALHVADLLANSANESQGSIEDMGIALQQSAAAARQAGFSVTETIALLTLLARNGLRASDAGTSLRTAIIRLINPTDKAQEKLDQLNVRLRDAQGNLRSDIFSQISEATADLTRKQQDMTFAVIFGQDAFRTQAILGREGAKALDEMLISVERAGKASEIAGARTKGFAGKVEALKNQLASLGIVVGDISIGPLSFLVELVSSAAAGMQRGIEAAQSFADVLKEVAKAGEEGGAAFTENLPFFGDVTPEAEKFFDILGEGLKLTAGGPLIATGNQIGFIADQFGLGADKISEDAEDVANSIKKILDQLESAGGGSTALNQAVLALQKLQDELQKGSPAAQQLAADIQVIIDSLTKGPPLAFPDLRAPKIPPVLIPPPETATFERGVKESIEIARRNFGDLGRESRQTVGQINAVFDQILKAGDDPKALRAAAAALAEIKKNVPSTEIANRLQSIIDRILAVGNLPPITLPDIEIPPSLRTGELGKEIGDDIKDPLARALTGQPIFDIGRDLLDAIAAGAKSKADKVGEEIAAALASGLRRSTLIEEAIAAGDEQAELAERRTRLRKNKRRQSALQRLPETQENLNKRKVVAAAITADQNAIEAILEGQKRDAQEARDKIVKAQNDADQAVIESFSAAETGVENKIIAAGEDNVKRQIRLTTILRNLYRRQIREAEKKIKDAETRNQVVTELTRKRIEADQDLIRLEREQDEEARRLKQERNQRREDILAINVEIAQTTGNQAAVRRALNAEIKFFEERLRQFPKGSLQRKQYVLKLRQAQKELRDIKEAEQDRKDEFAAMAFEFLTTTQGFGATLLGNLLPFDALGGTVGGVSGPAGGQSAATVPSPATAVAKIRGVDPLTGRPLRESGGPSGGPAAALQQAGLQGGLGERGITQLQAARMIALMGQMVGILAGISRRGGHPSSRSGQSRANAGMDTHK